MVMPLLHLFGVPAQVDGVLITTPNGYFEVAEACSGAKFVIAMIAYGALVANVCYRHAGRRRAAFMAMALVVPVIANGAARVRDDLCGVAGPRSSAATGMRPYRLWLGVLRRW